MRTALCRNCPAVIGLTLVFLLASIPGDAQTADQGTASTPNPAELLARIEALNRRVDELSRLVETLRTRAPEASKSETPQTTGSPAMAVSAENRPVPAVNTVPARPTSSEQLPKEISLLRFSGDFRLRLDGIIRPAFNAETSDQQSLTHVQNIRGRYRLRLNIDSDIHPMVSFHGQVASGPVNNPLTLDQDFAGITARHPFQINEAWVNFHPAKWVVLHGGRVQETFADYNLRYLFDDDLTVNGFNQRFTVDLSNRRAGLRRIEFRAGQYIFTNPNIAIVTPGNLGPTGAVIGSTGRAAQMFHQGFLVEQGLSPKASHTFGADIQVYRNANQIQFASTQAGFPLLVQNPLGVALSGPLPGTGNATTTPGGAIYTARNFQVARLIYRFDHEGNKSGRQDYPVSINIQVSRNVGTGAAQRDGLMASFRIGRIKKAWDYSFLYLFAIKGANSMISQLTDDDLGTLTGVNVRSHHFRFDLGLSKRIQFQSLFFTQNELSNSGQFPNFYVPVNGYAPRLYRFQEQVLFAF
jgi:hypothetical protein